MKTYLPAGHIKRITMNRHVIAANKKVGRNDPPLSVQTSKGTYRAHVVNIEGSSKIVYNQYEPLTCGATAWVETKAAIEFDDYAHSAAV